MGYFWALYSVPFTYVSVFMPESCCLDYCRLRVYSLISDSMIPSTLFFLTIAMAIQVSLWLYTNFWIICSSSVKYIICILIGIALNL